MTKTFMMLGTLSMSIAYGQENRVGINTEVPQATLDVRETPLSLLPAGTPQGVSFPNFSSDERTKFTGVSEGTMIYNTDLDCIEQYTLREKISPNLDWYCMCLCGDETEVVEVDDDVLMELYGLRITLIPDSGPYSSSSGHRYYSPSIYNGNIFENLRDGESMEVGENHEGKFVRGVSGSATTGIRYNAQESGKYTEKRLTFTGDYFVNNEKTERKISFDIVIPAGRVEAGEGVLAVYIELPEGVSVIHPAGVNYDNSKIDVSGTLSYKPFDVNFIYMTEE